eukprot:11726213-Heterocapsa_arctica.AAC.1
MPNARTHYRPGATFFGPGRRVLESQPEPQPSQEPQQGPQMRSGRRQGLAAREAGPAFAHWQDHELPMSRHFRPATPTLPDDLRPLSSQGDDNCPPS